MSESTADRLYCSPRIYCIVSKVIQFTYTSVESLGALCTVHSLVESYCIHYCQNYGVRGVLLFLFFKLYKRKERMDKIPNFSARYGPAWH